MGNCTSEQARLLRIGDLSGDPTAFRVFVKKRNKFIPGWLKINDDEIIYTRGGNFQFWPLAYLRRYGYTCSGVFFFESGRRCASGEGLHTFQSHQAERIFHLVQSKIKIEEYARGSRAPSISSNRVNNVASITNNRIHPVQRFYSEGSNNEFTLPGSEQQCPTPYQSYQDSRRFQQPSPSSLASAPLYNSRPSLDQGRPRSVLSAMGHSVRQNNNNFNGINPMMNQSFHSIDGAGSPWQLEGEIVLEHVLSNSNQHRQRLAGVGNGALPQPQVSYPQNYAYRPPPIPPRHHTYVNLEFPLTTISNSSKLNIRRRQEFLNSGPFSTQPNGIPSSNLNGQCARFPASNKIGPMNPSFHDIPQTSSLAPPLQHTNKFTQQPNNKQHNKEQMPHREQRQNSPLLQHPTAFRPITSVTVTNKRENAPEEPLSNKSKV